MNQRAQPRLVWSQMQVETKLAIVELAIKNGETCVDIAKNYSATKGQVVGFANKRGLYFGSRRAADAAILGAESVAKIKRLPGRKPTETIKNINYWQANGAQASAQERLGLSVALCAFAPKAKREMVKLADLQEGQCKWPFDTDAGTRFCGAGCDVGSSYCGAHRQTAYRRVLK